MCCSLHVFGMLLANVRIFWEQLLQLLYIYIYIYIFFFFNRAFRLWRQLLGIILPPEKVLTLFDVHGTVHHNIFIYRFRQKYLTILQNSCEWNRWRGEFVLERSSSEAQSISVAMERWFVEHRAFAVETYFKKQRFCLDSEDISSALQYSSERVSLVAILLPLRTSQEQGVRK